MVKTKPTELLTYTLLAELKQSFFELITTLDLLVCSDLCNMEWNLLLPFLRFSIQ